jgi:hypothetical protein
MRIDPLDKGPHDSGSCHSCCSSQCLAAFLPLPMFF